MFRTGCFQRKLPACGHIFDRKQTVVKAQRASDLPHREFRRNLRCGQNINSMRLGVTRVQPEKGKEAGAILGRAVEASARNFFDRHKSPMSEPAGANGIKSCLQTFYDGRFCEWASSGLLRLIGRRNPSGLSFPARTT